MKEWTSIATISIQEPIEGYPFANIFSMSDGSSVANSSGVPYFYIPSLEMSVHDLQVRYCTPNTLNKLSYNPVLS